MTGFDTTGRLKPTHWLVMSGAMNALPSHSHLLTFSTLQVIYYNKNNTYSSS